MNESVMMKEVRKAKNELSEQARKMSRNEYIEFIKKEAEAAKKTIEHSMASK